MGALMAMLEKRRKALAAEGLFDAGRKRALPYLPEVIGVVTSPVRRGDPRHPAPPARPVSAQGADLARRRAGRALRARGAAAIAGFNALAPAARCRGPTC